MIENPLPLFPLNTVLFPGAVLSLRIFEPRYLSMIGQCMRQGKPFGVVLITDGNEAGHAAQFHSIGTTATIQNFDQLEDGKLGITCQGEDRFRVIDHQIQSDQLVICEAEGYAIDDQSSVRLNTEQMRSVLKRLTEQEELSSWISAMEARWEDDEWLSYRLAELFSTSMHNRQALLEMSVADRLSDVEKIMIANKVINRELN